MLNTQEVLQNATKAQKVVLANGLTVIVCPMPQFTGVHAMYATHFGSIDNHFIVDGKEVHLPAGVAHFLEHKMFENEDGDAFSLYAKTGANANAYTSFDKTCYVFTAADHIDENLDILLSFVSKPHFTTQSIAKEQGIIGQEIKMYEDAPDWRIMFALLENLYANHPVRCDIAGTVDSIAQITPAMLYTCTDAFYSAGAMTLCVAGNVTQEQVLAAVQRAKLPVASHTVQKVPVQETAEVHNDYTELFMDVAQPTLGIAFKEQPLAQNDCKSEYIADMLGEVIVGSMTPLYRKLYDEGLIAGEFSSDFFSLENCLCLMFTGEVTNPELVQQMLFEEIERVRKDGIDEEIFTLCKNMMYGELVMYMDSMESVAIAQLGSHYKNRELAQEITALASLTVQDMNNALQTMLQKKRSTTVVIRKADAK